MTKLWKAMNTTESVTVSVEDYEKNGFWVEQEIRKLTDEYEDLDLHTLREQLSVDSVEIQKVQTQIYGISLFLILFSMFNLINTVISSVTARKRIIDVRVDRYGTRTDMQNAVMGKLLSCAAESFNYFNGRNVLFLSFCCFKQQDKISLVERIKVTN